MFDVGFSELMVIAVVALIVIGPERLPGVARTLGHLFGRLQRYVNDVKSDIRREIELDELRKFKTEFEQAAHGVQSDMDAELQKARDQFTEMERQAQAAISDLSAPAPEGAAPDASAGAAAPVQAGDTGAGQPQTSR
ncbi:MAG: twin-arginine translocase subunit TatB [Burkholderiales bacterium]|nr:twin-arginine translocase subunit TatB [Burkholderiales bacterium]